MELFWRYDWESSSIGGASTWPALLHGVVRFLLEARQPMLATWGEENILLFNEGFSAILGPDHGRALGRPIQEVWAPEWEKVRPFFEPARGGYATMAEDVPFRTWASGFREFRYFTFSYTPIRQEDGQICGVTAICTDTTERVRAQEQLQAERDTLGQWFEQAPGFVAMSEGPEHRFVLANAAYRAVVGGRDVIGKTVAEALPEVVSQGIIEILDGVYRSGEPFIAKSMPFRLRRRDGTDAIKYIDLVYAARRDPHGTTIGLATEGHDVTEHVATAQRASKLQKELIHLSRVSAMSALASTIAHELNQPLTAISAMASVSRRLAERGDYLGLANALQAIDDGVHRAGGIVKSVRAMSSKGEGSFGAVDLGDAIVETLTLLGPEHASRVESSVPPGLIAFADRIQVEQVLLNLLRNGLEAASPSNASRVSVSAERTGEQILIGVEDNGPGIAAVPISSVFDTFVSTKPGGIGIGLSISRTIVEAHGGNIWAENREEGGARFAFTLPAAQESPPGGGVPVAA